MAIVVVIICSLVRSAFFISCLFQIVINVFIHVYDIICICKDLLFKIVLVT